VRDVLPALERWAADGLRMAVATVVATERSAPRDPGAVLAVSERGEVAGSVTGGCVEPAVYEEAMAVLRGGPPRLLTYGIADEAAFEVGLSCGGTVQIFVEPFDAELLAPLRAALDAERPVALLSTVRGGEPGKVRLASAGDADEPVANALAHGESRLVEVGGELVFVSSFAPRPYMYVFGAVDHAGAVATIGHFLGYRVTVCDARAQFATRERFPDVDELVVAWPDEFLRKAPVGASTAIVVLTHDHRFDVPLLAAALRTDAAYIGAMGSRLTTEERAERLRAEGVTEDELSRLHAPIGLAIGARSPEEVAVAIAAELIEATQRRRAGRIEEAVTT
jgi:xanthine dehydrogenase accessory factor